MKIRNLPPYPSFDKYLLVLADYFDKQKFSDIPQYAWFEERADVALSAFSEARLTGKSVSEASEIANSILFENIGESEYKVLEKILEDNFKDNIDLTEDEFMEYWVYRILEDVPSLFNGCESSMEYGLSAADIDIMRDEIIGRIVTYLQSINLYGIQ